MNLRNAGEYNIGLDLGTGSVGWAVTDLDGELLHFKGKPTWGSRIFPSADTAAGARTARGQRRRYERRRWRLNLLQSLFGEEMQKVDAEFFIRLNQARLLKEDRAEGHSEYHWPLFNASDFTERDYYKKFPTIYHLRAWLMETNEKADLRLIYLAFHNIVKARGNFLHQDNPGLSAEKADMTSAIEHFCSVLPSWLESIDGDVPDVDNDSYRAKLNDILGNPSSTRRGKQADVQDALGLGKDKAAKDMAKEISNAFVGYKTEFSKIFGEVGETTKFALSDDERVEAYLEAVPDEALPLFEALCEVYSSFVLMGILFGGGEPITSGALVNVTGHTISYCKVREFEQYKADLALLKELVRTYTPGKYDEFFRGAFYEGTHKYNPSEARGYTKYDAKRGGQSYEVFFKDVKKLLGGTDAVTDERYSSVLNGFAEGRFLRRLKTSDNGSIPYQLHLEEMTAIIENQARFYPFLKQEQEKIESLVSFRIPYYVGPLTQKDAAKDKAGKLRFAWAERLPGKEDEPVYPWSWESVIDKNGAAQRFIQRMTNDCTYLMGEPVLPKCSLLYEEFCVLNELNGAKWSADGDNGHRFDYADRVGIIHELFREKRSVSFKNVEDWLRRERQWSSAHVFGGQGATKFESSLSSYRFFCKDIFKVDELPERDIPMVETIIRWNTLFEDRSILKEELERHFGPSSDSPRLSAEQIKIICKKRFTGWGKLSKELLDGIKAKTDNGPKTIMDIMREGDPAAGARANAMVFMEVLHDERLGFEEIIAERNAAKLPGNELLKVEDIPGSPALRRTVNQATRIVEEIARIAGHAPTNIFIETTREEDPKKKGNRTRRRYDKIKEAVMAFRSQNAELANELKGFRATDFDDERLVLYFMQGGKSLYSDTPLDVSRLSDPKYYQVDHIIPQSYIKDDSFENKALVLSSENQRKTDAMLIDPDIRQKMAKWWRALHDAELIGDKKFDNLMRSNIGENKLKGFIARQLVETSQIVKLTKMMLENHVPEARVVPIRASLSHELREAKKYYKCREINDFHHAHDALLAAEVGRFLLKRHSAMYDKPIGYTHVVRDFVRKQQAEAKREGRMPGSASFFIASFLRSGFSKETGEVFKDDWDADFECERIRKYLNYKQVFISRMPEETSGAFWDATIYSPRDKKGAIPLKKDLDPTKYGNYSCEQFAYFFIYSYLNKKGKLSYAFSPVPVRLAPAVASNADALKDFARNEAAENGGQFVEILRRRIYKYQQIEVGPDRFYITGKKEVRNARQFSFTQGEMKAIISTLNGEAVDMVVASNMYEKLGDAFAKLTPRLSSLIKAGDICKFMANDPTADAGGLLRSLIALASGKSNREDLRSAGGSRAAGCIQPSFSKLLSSEGGITFIDQSVTGMFEKRTTIGGL